MHVVQLRRLAFEVTAEAEEPKGRSQNVADSLHFCLGHAWGDLR